MSLERNRKAYKWQARSLRELHRIYYFDFINFIEFEKKMIAEGLRPETVQAVVDLGMLAAPLLGMAFNVAQREWFKRVYGGKCVASNIGMKHNCGPDLQIHHFDPPQGWGYEHLGMTEDQIDNKYNGIPFCGDGHVGNRGTPDCEHPDQYEALIAFKNGDKDAFKNLQTVRIDKARSGVVYWNQKWTSNIRKYAHQMVDKYEREHPDDRFPEKKHYKNHNGHNGHNGKT